MGNTTPNLGLYRPDIGEVNWGAQVNGNFTKLDDITSGSAFGIPSVGYLQGGNNAGAPNTKFDLSADYVEMRNPTTGLVVVRAAPINSVCDLGVNGANGLDTGVQAANTWYHFYFIWNGVVLASLASLQGPPTGPALLPAGYTYWAYAHTIRSNASVQLVPTVVRGATAFYLLPPAALSGGSAVVETAVPLAALIAPNSLRAQLDLRELYGETATINMTFNVRLVTGVNYSIRRITAPVGVLTVPGGDLVIPNVALNFFYLWVIGTGTAPAATVYVASYTVANGDS